MPKSKTKLSDSFGSELRRARESARYGLRELARETGIHPTYLSKVELGQAPMPSWEKAMSLVKALDSDSLVFMLIKYDISALAERIRQIDKLAETWSDERTERLKQAFEDVLAQVRAGRVEIKITYEKKREERAKK